MSISPEAIAYAEEVYAACATIGFHNEDVARLKTMLDAGPDQVVDGGALSRLTQEVQRRAIAWAGRAC